MIDIEKYKERALSILSPIKSADNQSKAKKDFLFSATRSTASASLSPHYLIYFLFAELLGFKNLGRFEKIAWSFPIDYNGRAFLVEFRKFGVGVFVQNSKLDEKRAREIVKKINDAIKSVTPFYDHIAEEAIKGSKLNVLNNNKALFERFNYLLSLYKKQQTKYLKNKGKYKVKKVKSKFGESTSYDPLDFEFHQRANWLAISCIEAFFSWTEHLFIHLAIIGQNVTDGTSISSLIESEWKTKFTAAIPLSSKQVTKFYNELLLVRQQMRNFVAHGAFGKNGNAFQFHSNAGAVPVLMNHKKQKNRFSLHGTLTFKEEDVIKLIEDFIDFLWKGPLRPAMFYAQECGLPTIVTFASDGTFLKATENMDNMSKFTRQLGMEMDNAGNMDW